MAVITNVEVDLEPMAQSVDAVEMAAAFRKSIHRIAEYLKHSLAAGRSTTLVESLESRSGDLLGCIVVSVRPKASLPSSDLVLSAVPDELGMAGLLADA
jgi:hypothetical protein